MLGRTLSGVKSIGHGFLTSIGFWFVKEVRLPSRPFYNFFHLLNETFQIYLIGWYVRCSWWNSLWYQHNIGQTDNSFEERLYQHSNTFKNQQKANSTELSKHIWSLKENNTTPILSWEMIDRARLYRMEAKHAVCA